MNHDRQLVKLLFVLYARESDYVIIFLFALDIYVRTLNKQTRNVESVVQFLPISLLSQ